MKKKGVNINIHLTNRWLYTFIAIAVIALIAVGVTAYTGPVGHTSDQIDVTWSQILSRPSGLDDGDQVGITSESDPTVQSWAKNANPTISGTLTAATIRGNLDVVTQTQSCDSTQCIVNCPAGYYAVTGGCYISETDTYSRFRGSWAAIDANQDPVGWACYTYATRQMQARVFCLRD